MGIYRIGETIRMLRNFFNLTQEDLTAEICDVVTLSRIENGKHSPGSNVYRKLMERLGRETVRAYAILSGDNFQIMEYQKDFEDALEKLEFEKAGLILGELEKVIDDSPRNRQYMKRGKAIINRALGRLSDQEARMQLEEALRITIKEWKNRNLEWYPFGELEALILCNISNTYLREGNGIKVIEILGSLYKALNRDYMWGEGKIDIEIMMLNNLANAYGITGKHKEAVNLADKAIKICKREKRTGSLPQLLGEREWNMEQLMEKGEDMDITKEQCEENLRQAYYLAIALGKENIATQIRKHYEDYFLQKLF